MHAPHDGELSWGRQQTRMQRAKVEDEEEEEEEEEEENTESMEAKMARYAREAEADEEDRNQKDAGKLKDMHDAVMCRMLARDAHVCT